MAGPPKGDEKGYYLSGLFEGDGNIYTRRFMIIFCLEDISLAHYLSKYFKIGYINPAPPYLL